MTPPIPIHTFVSATFRPKLPAGSIPPGNVIPWMGARLTWMSFLELNFGSLKMKHPANPATTATSFLLLVGSDGFAVLEDKPLYGPQIVAMPGDLAGIKVVGNRGEKS